MTDNTKIEWNPKRWNPQFWRNGVLERNDARLLQPLRRRTPTTYLLETADLFDENVPDDWIDRVFAVMALCPQHTFQVLTKRSDRMRGYLAKCITDRIISQAHQMDSIGGAGLNAEVHIARKQLFPLPNVWLGVSVEDQTAADERIPDLLATPTAWMPIPAGPEEV